MEAIAPLLESTPLSRERVKSRAAEVRKSPATLYRWIELWRSSEHLSSLLPKQRGPSAGGSRLSSAVEEIVASVLNSAKSKLPRPSTARLAHRIVAECQQAGLKPPHIATLRRRLKARRQSQKRRPVFGNFPGADGPLAVVQIDHTKLDVVVVDERERLALGRPWLTLAIDVYSRCIVGFYLSLDPPGIHSVGLCLVHAVLPKDLWLAKLDSNYSWPVSGLMDLVHADNGPEFHSKALERATEEWGIRLNWRPARRPWYGGHIERLLGTVSKELHQLPGTTMSNPRERGKYDAQHGAALTLTELERWLVLWITGVYHEHLHREIGTSPIVRFQEGLRLADLKPRVVNDAVKFSLDFMPLYERSVGRDGIRLDGICYWSDVLRPHIESRDPGDPSKKRKFPVRRDPRDISTVWFWDAETSAYQRVPYRNLSHPATSIWELRRAYRAAKSQVQGRITEADVFKAHEQMLEVEKDAIRKTRTMRRNEARRRDGSLPAPGQASPGRLSTASDLHREPILPFEEIEDF